MNLFRLSDVNVFRRLILLLLGRARSLTGKGHTYINDNEVLIRSIDHKPGSKNIVTLCLRY